MPSELGNRIGRVILEAFQVTHLELGARAEPVTPSLEMVAQAVDRELLRPGALGDIVTLARYEIGDVILLYRNGNHVTEWRAAEAGKVFWSRQGSWEREEREEPGTGPDPLGEAGELGPPGRPEEDPQEEGTW